MFPIFCANTTNSYLLGVRKTVRIIHLNSRPSPRRLCLLKQCGKCKWCEIKGLAKCAKPAAFTFISHLRCLPSHAPAVWARCEFASQASGNAISRSFPTPNKSPEKATSLVQSCAGGKKEKVRRGERRLRDVRRPLSVSHWVSPTGCRGPVWAPQSPGPTGGRRIWSALTWLSPSVLRGRELPPLSLPVRPRSLPLGSVCLPAAAEVCPRLPA